MKKLIIILILLLCGCTRKNEELNYNQMYNKTSNYDTYILYFCSNQNECENYIKSTKKIYYINTSKLKSQEELVIESLYFNGNNIENLSILKIEKGIVKNKLSGNKSNEEINNFLKEE